MKKMFTLIQVILYHIICHKWEISAYSLLTAEIITFISSLLSGDMGSYSGIMAIIALSGIATAVKLNYQNKIETATVKSVTVCRRWSTCTDEIDRIWCEPANL